MSYANLAKSLQAGPGITITPNEGTGATAVVISATGSYNGNVIFTATEFPCSLIGVDANIVLAYMPEEEFVVIELPPSMPGMEFTIKDAVGRASVPYPLAVIPALPNSIDGDNEVNITVPYGSVTLVGTATGWSVI